MITDTRGSGTTPTVLFIDDEPHVLAGLRRALSPLRRSWEMTFVDSGDAAVGLLRERGFDVVVSDMLMPGMDGVTVLRHVRELRPEAARVVLSGHADVEQIAAVTAVAHRYLQKPTDVETLRGLLDELLRENERTTIGLRELIGRIDRLPSHPRVYEELRAELERDDPSLGRAAAIVREDVAISAKLLQLVNSAFFGLGQRVTLVEQAVSLLGIEVVSSLALTMGLFQSVAALEHEEALEEVWSHSMAVAGATRALATHPDLRAELVPDVAFTAGLLHDIGLITLLVSLPDEMSPIDSGAVAGAVDSEEEVNLGSSHTELGAHLLRLWGIPESLAQAVEGHHRPARVVRPADPQLLALVHLADAWDRAGGVLAELDVDREFLDTALGARWMETCESALGGLRDVA